MTANMTFTSAFLALALLGSTFAFTPAPTEPPGRAACPDAAWHPCWKTQKPPRPATPKPRKPIIRDCGKAGCKR